MTLPEVLSRKLILLLPVLLTSCANLQEDAAALGKATSCCASLSSLPATSVAARSHYYKLSPESPHFDFGEGLAPFVRFAVDPTQTSHLLIAAQPRGSGTAWGGDGTAHYLSTRAIFFAQTGERLPEIKHLPQSLRLMRPVYAFNLTRVFEVPANAAWVVLTTRSDELGWRGALPVVQPGRLQPAGGVLISIPSYDGVKPMTISPYGDATIHFESDLRSAQSRR